MFFNKVSYLFVHEDVYNWVDHGAALGKKRGNYACNRWNDSWSAKCGHYGHHTVRRPAQQVTHHCGDDHNQQVEISPSGWLTNLPQLKIEKQEVHIWLSNYKGVHFIFQTV